MIQTQTMQDLLADVLRLTEQSKAQRAEIESLEVELRCAQGNRDGHPDMCCGICHDTCHNLTVERDALQDKLAESQQSHAKTISELGEANKWKDRLMRERNKLSSDYDKLRAEHEALVDSQ